MANNFTQTAPASRAQTQTKSAPRPQPPSGASLIDEILEHTEMQEEIKRALPKEVESDRFCDLLRIAGANTLELNECTEESVKKCILAAAEQGWSVSGYNPDAYILPFYDKRVGSKVATLIPNYRGLVKSAIYDGMLAAVEVHLVYEKDHFDFDLGSDEKVRSHIPAWGNRGKVLGGYALFRLKNGLRQVERMTVEEINKIKARSKAASSGPWVTDEGEMQRKTIFKRGIKWIPLKPGSKLQAALSLETVDYAAETEEPIAPTRRASEGPEPNGAETEPEPSREPAPDEPEPAKPFELDPSWDVVQEFKGPNKGKQGTYWWVVTREYGKCVTWEKLIADEIENALASDVPIGFGFTISEHNGVKEIIGIESMSGKPVHGGNPNG
jgi:recombination protein RecT